MPSTSSADNSIEMCRTRVKWLLRQIMSDKKISNNALATELGVHHVTISKWKNSDELPPIGGEMLGKICDALTKLNNYEDGWVCKVEDLLDAKVMNTNVASNK